MSSMEKTNNLEETPDFGDSTLNKIFKEQDEKTQKEILNYKNKDIQVSILKDIANPELKKLYESMTAKNKAQIDSGKIREKYTMLKELLKNKKKNDKPLSPDSAKTPEEPPPPLKNKTAIIIPFRESDKDKKTRSKQLDRLLKYMNEYLKNANHTIYVIEQSNDKRKFNRGALLNIGFLAAEEDGCDVFVFHDVDLLPSNELKEYYTDLPDSRPVHIASVWNRYNQNPHYFGGIVAFNKDSFKRINGYPNNFWGWGGEDDELYNRVKHFYTVKKVQRGSILDMEEMNLQDKLDYLRENDLKFMKKKEALAQHNETWKQNGLNNLHYEVLSTDECGENCVKIVVDLGQLDDKINEVNEGVTLNAPDELFKKEEYKTKEDKKLDLPQASHAFDKLLNLYYQQMSSNRDVRTNHEFEVRFGTKGIKPLTKNDYDNVVRVLKSFGFETYDPIGLFSLRVKCEFLDTTTGRFKMSDIRTEINGLTAIEKICKSNDIKTVYKDEPQSIKFMSKKPFITNERVMIRPVNFDEFNFRAGYSLEETAKKGVENYILDNWRKSKKEFRYLNRVTFKHPDYPVMVDLSITKSGTMGKDKRGFNYITPVYTLEESNVFNNRESYEIEIEIDNNNIGPGTRFNAPELVADSVRKVIKYVLGGLQGTMYPVSYIEQEEILREYMKMIWVDNYEPSRRINTYNFIGPSSVTLQLTNIAPIDENSNAPNIRKDFIVTEKADGERHLMYISKHGKIYLINSNMDVKFTGAKTLNEDCFNTLFDGELIKYDKNGTFINLYAAFDIYYHKNKDVRSYTFTLTKNEKDVYKCRYYLLEKIKNILNPISILDTTTTNNIKQALSKNNKPVLSPIRFEVKKFYPMSEKQSIFDGCKLILEREKQGLYEYEIDGLIFTHEFYGVGSNIIGKAGPKTKITWDNSFKWKPPQYNTIDFLVTTLKSQTGEDNIYSLFEDGIVTNAQVQFNQYKMIELRCGFSEKNDGFINPCQDIIDDNIPEYKSTSEDKVINDYVPKRFYPTEPYDVNAGLCKLMLRMDDAGAMQMFTESNEVITDNTIVEFAYDINGVEGWMWKPLRVRHDKTSKLLRGEKEYGNSYKVCNENWKSIHPAGRIDEIMLMTGLNIPSVSISEDIYYNTPAGKMKTESLKNFHNLYVKKLLINSVSKQGDTLIDFACGKGGDLSKWIASKLSFVFGIDFSKDNLENRLDGACARYLKSRQNNKHVPYALFVHGNSSQNIKDGSAMLNDRAKQIAAAVFGNGPKDSERIGKGVAKQYGKGDTGFNVSSCQFAIHYFFENPDMLRGFLRNVAECTKLNGYFIGTCYDGRLIFNELKRLKQGESIQINEDGKKIWEIIKDYSSDQFENDSSSIGYKINVYQESINRHALEYLVNFEYFERIMELYGFKIIGREEANELGLSSGTGLFSEMFIDMLDEIKRNKFKATMYGTAPNMTTFEKKISFLNRYFVYKKVREVNIEKIYIELGEYNEAVIHREKNETAHAINIAKEEVKIEKSKTKIRKLNKKIELVPATEALEDKQENKTKMIEETIEQEKKMEQEKKALKPKKKLKIVNKVDNL